jgi:hypothetical protein
MRREVVQKRTTPAGPKVRAFHHRIGQAMRAGHTKEAMLLLECAPLPYRGIVALLTFYRQTRD